MLILNTSIPEVCYYGSSMSSGATTERAAYLALWAEGFVGEGRFQLICLHPAHARGGSSPSDVHLCPHLAQVLDQPGSFTRLLVTPEILPPE